MFCESGLVLVWFDIRVQILVRRLLFNSAVGGLSLTWSTHWLHVSLINLFWVYGRWQHTTFFRRFVRKLRGNNRWSRCLDWMRWSRSAYGRWQRWLYHCALLFCNWASSATQLFDVHFRTTSLTEGQRYRRLVLRRLYLIVVEMCLRPERRLFLLMCVRLRILNRALKQIIKTVVHLNTLFVGLNWMTQIKKLGQCFHSLTKLGLQLFPVF